MTAGERGRTPEDVRRVFVGQIPAGQPRPGQRLGVLLHSLPGAVAGGRGNVGGTLAGTPAGHRYAAALGPALAGERVVPGSDA